MEKSTAKRPIELTPEQAKLLERLSPEFRERHIEGKLAMAGQGVRVVEIPADAGTGHGTLMRCQATSTGMPSLPSICGSRPTASAATPAGRS